MKRAATFSALAAAVVTVTRWDASWGTVALGVLVVVVFAVEGRLTRRVRTVSAVVAAYREGDFSIRVRSATDRVLGDLEGELNALGDVLRSHRLGEMEAWTLLRKVLSEVDVVVLAFGEDGRIRLANESAARVLGRASRDLVGEPAGELSELLVGAAPRVVRLGGESEWELRRGTFRLSGEPHVLVVLADVSRALRMREREAWQRLVRVMGHEINNSLSPIGSIAGSLRSLLDGAARPPDWEDDLREGLGVIGRRAEALGRFMGAYARLARLPPPKLGPVHIATLVRKVVALESRTAVDVVDGADVVVDADADQLEQALINVVKNAAEAMRTGVTVRWTVVDGAIEIAVEDDGPGVSATANLFVPFFTTKPGGSGIGLVLARQIIEGHDGQLSLASRTDGAGAVARIRLPIGA